MKETIECMVVEVEQDRVKARAKMHSDCSSCGICEGNQAIYYEAINKVGAKCGQSVIVEVEKQSVLKIAFMIFILPLLTIAVGSILGIIMAKDMHIPSLPPAIILSLIALIPIFFYIRRYDAKIQGQSSTPVVTKIL